MHKHFLPLVLFVGLASGQDLPFDHIPQATLTRPIRNTDGNIETTIEAVLKSRSGVFVDATLCRTGHKLEELKMISAIPSIESVHIAVRADSYIGTQEVAALAKISALKTLTLGGADNHLAVIDWQRIGLLKSVKVLRISVLTIPDQLTKALISNGQSFHIPIITITLLGQRSNEKALEAVQDFESKWNAAVPGRYSVAINGANGVTDPSISLTYLGGELKK